MATGAIATTAAVGGRKSLPAWPLYALFVALPIWWAMGAAYFIWPLLTFPLFFYFLLRGDVRIPPRFGLWLLFLAWMLLASLRATDASMAVVLYRASLYVSATLLFLYVFNTRRDGLPDRTIVKLMAIFWAEVIVGGLVGVLVPHFSFSTPVEALLPAGMLQDETAYNFVHPGVADVMTFLGYPVGRPKTLFAFTNQWGACAAVLTPFALAAMSQMRPGAPRRALGLLLILSVVPIVMSLNRGLWLALGIGLAYVAFRFAGRRDLRAVAGLVVAVAAVALVVMLTPLSGLVEDRFTGDQATTESRLTVYQATIDQIDESPLFGFGSPSHGAQDADLPPLGSHGQLFTIAYSYGLPALLLFAGWFVYGFLRSMRRGSPSRFWANAVILILLVEMPYYNYMPATLHVAMVAAALLWRDICEPVRPSRARGATVPRPAVALP
ncbi:MAG: O-antigen ligase family protein [Solirubrobacteraceae bacterium]